MSLANIDSLSPKHLEHSEQDLIASVLGHLRRCDEDALEAELHAHWPRERLITFLASNDDNVVKVAAACLGCVGTSADYPALAAALHHDDSVVVAMAEHALWEISFRQGPPALRRRLCRAVCLIEFGRYSLAIRVLDEVTRHAPWFVEAHNQRAIAHYLSGNYAEALADCRRAIRLNPLHFGAVAGAGHALVQMGRYREAIDAYHRALAIHPRLDGIRQSIRKARAYSEAPTDSCAG